MSLSVKYSRADLLQLEGPLLLTRGDRQPRGNHIMRVYVQDARLEPALKLNQPVESNEYPLLNNIAKFQSYVYCSMYVGCFNPVAGG